MTPTHVDCRNCMWDSGVTGVENNCFSSNWWLVIQRFVAGASFDSASSDICVTRLVSREVNIRLSVIGIQKALVPILI